MAVLVLSELLELPHLEISCRIFKREFIKYIKYLINLVKGNTLTPNPQNKKR